MESLSWQVQEWEKQFYQGRALSKEIITRHIKRLIRSIQNGKGVILIAAINNICVGYVVGVIHSDFLNTEDAFLCQRYGC